MAPTYASTELQRSLRRFITFDQVTCVVAVGVILVVQGWLHPSGYLLLMAVVVGVAAGVMGMGRRPLAAGNQQRAVLWVAGANWGVAAVATAVATFCLPVTVVAAMLPSVLAVPYVGPQMLWRINGVSFAVGTLTVVVGTTQDFSGLTDDLPSWVPPAVLAAFVPFMVGLVVMIGAHNSARLRRALAETMQVNEQLVTSEQSLRQSRARLAVATDAERRRIARDLHDGAQQRLLSIALGVRRAGRLVRTDPVGAHTLLDGLSGEVEESIAELRNLAQGVYPAVLTDLGLAEALRELAGRAPGPCELDVARLCRYAPEVEAAVYWCCVEALQNVAKHAGEGTRVRVRVTPRPAATLLFEVEDAGPGLPPDFTRGQGLTNMADRIGAMGGELSVLSPSGSGVCVRGVVPAPGEAMDDFTGARRARESRCVPGSQLPSW
ncbi:MAG: histidine kinase [Actinobacteria bacterium]|nr:histidine kinase [Actinomycetota bacterium]